MVLNNLIRTLCIVLSTPLLLACSDDVPPAKGSAAVAMPDTYSAAVASDILAQGGNAVDASIAAAFALAVTWPEAGNIGGGGFMLIQFDGEAQFIDYRETAPLGASRDKYLDENGDAVQRDSLVGHRAAGVPGTVAGLWKAHQMYGSLPWADLVDPAIRLAADGFIAHEQLAESVSESIDWFGSDANFHEHFGTLKSGELFRQEDLARTLTRIAAEGPDDFYRGETARLIVAEMQRGDGLIAAEDLQRYEAVLREPLRANWRGYEILSAPPPSSGGFAVIQLLKIKDLLQHEFDQVPHNSPQYIHLVAEIEKRVFADRAEYLGDPDYFDVPMDQLLSDTYLRRRASEIDPDNISSIEAVPPGIESMDTTHFSILDQFGNAVSNTYTLNWTFGNGVVVEGAGFLLNDEMDDFSVKPGVANAYGAVGGTANEIQPGKRMLSSMSPTILLKDGKVELVVGTPGGTTIFTSVFQTITNIYDFNMTPLQAAGAGRFHHQLLPPDLVTYSPGVPLAADVISTLGDLGYRAEPHPFRFGDVQVIQVIDDEIHAASDPRKRGEARVTH